MSEEISISDLFDDEEELEALAQEFAVDVPSVYIALPGGAPQRIAIAPGMDTVAQILDSADITLRASDQSIWVDGTPAGLETQVQPGSTITAVGRAKGG